MTSAAGVAITTAIGIAAIGRTRCKDTIIHCFRRTFSVIVCVFNIYIVILQYEKEVNQYIPFNG